MEITRDGVSGVVLDVVVLVVGGGGGVEDTQEMSLLSPMNSLMCQPPYPDEFECQ